MARKKTLFTFFKHTPFQKANKYIYFNNHDEREKFFFDDNRFERVDSIEYKEFNFIKDKGVLNVSIPFIEARGVNYCGWISEVEGIRYFGFVVGIEYINDNVTRFHILIDVLTTFCIGDFTKFMNIANVERMHLPKKIYKEYEYILMNNSDVLNMNTNRYVYNEFYDFDKMSVLFQSSVDLSKDFGKVDAPKIQTSRGGVVDGLASPVDLYTIDYDSFQDFNKEMSDFPWITQNFQNIFIVPSKFIKSESLEKVDLSKNNVKSTKLYRIKDKYASNNLSLTTLNQSRDTIKKNAKIEKAKDFVCRTPYVTIEAHNYQGDMLTIDFEKLPSRGLTFESVVTLGYHNEIAIYVKDYLSNNESGAEKTRGQFINNALFFKNFDSVPILIDNYKRSLSQSAYQRELTQERLFTNKASNMITGENSTQRLMDTASVLSNVSFNAMSTLGNVFGGINNDYEYYRNLKAEMKDKAITPPSITNQSTSNGLAIGNHFYGITLKISCIDFKDVEQIERYHGTYGFELNRQMKISLPTFMTHAHYYKFSADWFIPFVEPPVMEMIRALFESGVTAYTNNGQTNPFMQDLIHNDFIEEES